MAIEDKEKDYREPLILAERAIAEIIAGIADISALCPPLKGKSAVPVFSASDESAKFFLDSNIQKGLKQVVEVAFVRTLSDGVVQTSETEVFADCLFRVSVSAPQILAENAPFNTTTVASIIARELHGCIYAYPFSPTTPFLVQGISREVSEKDFITMLELKIRTRIF